MNELLYSPIMRLVYDNLTSKGQQEYLEIVAELPTQQMNKKRFFEETISLIAKQVAQATADVNTHKLAVPNRAA